MTELFDSYRSNYRDVVQSSIDFSGLPHSFFMRAKADLLRELIARRLGPEKPATLEVGCGIGSFHPLLGSKSLNPSCRCALRIRPRHCLAQRRASAGMMIANGLRGILS